ncbi:hypothetical protein [Streptomyces griseomycini]|uniref:Lipoprotein n=1 Tax=Streptomyces griseomycini TaxID=66895 RepID=A0A7W7PWD9_9ACTN|nr:hypothetical protein [Streptomyces griseomycini]MBB4902408.1 hypothetical protein [Streptomyces griseomycini]GGR45990.1 lipoprotein [Streptomyces griseomycini]
MSLFVRRNVTSWGPAALAALALLTTSCAGQDGEASASRQSPSASATPHGYVEGAREAAEQQSRLLLNDPDTGDTRVLDLITGKAHEVSRTTGASGLTTDGRFGYLHTANGTRVLDGGAWTVDHGDHVHYYRAAIRDAGRIPAGTGARIRSDAAVTAVTGGDGRAALYRRNELEKGEVGNPRTLPGTHASAVVPYAEHLLALTADGGGAVKVVVRDRKGRRVAAPEAECESPRGDAVTRRGVVFGCADGALLISEDDGGFAAEKISYGADVPARERAASFHHRAGSDTLTARAGRGAVWVLDVTERTWTRVRTGPVVAVNTAGEGSPLLVLQDDGALHGYDITTGKRVSRTERLLTDVPEARTDGTAGPAIEVDRSRAYLNDPAGNRVYEIDYNDNLRVARTFGLDMEPTLMAETGR